MEEEVDRVGRQGVGEGKRMGQFIVTQGAGHWGCFGIGLTLNRQYIGRSPAGLLRRLPHLSDALAPPSPGCLEHDGVADQLAGSHRLLHCVDAGLRMQDRSEGGGWVVGAQATGGEAVHADMAVRGLIRTLRYTSGGMTPSHSAYDTETPLPLHGSVGTDAAWARMVDPICRQAGSRQGGHWK